MANKRIKDLDYETVLGASRIIPIDDTTYTDAKRTTLDDVKNYCNDNFDIVLDDIINVDAGSANDGDILSFDSGVWEAVSNTSGGGIPEAPIDGTTYGRNNEAWTPVSSGGIPEAPNDGFYYARNDSAWEKVTEEAPIDGTTYGRKDGSWIASSGGGENGGFYYGWKAAPANTVTPGDGYFSFNNTNPTLASSLRINKNSQTQETFNMINDMKYILIRDITNNTTSSHEITNNVSNVTYNILTINNMGGGGDLLGLSTGTEYNISFLTDVGSTGGVEEAPLTGYQYVRESGDWTAVTIPEFMDDLGNVDASSASDGDVLVFDSGNWEAVQISLGLDDLNDVDLLSGANDNDVLTYNNATGKWNAEASTVGGSISSLSDTTITNPTNNQILKYNTATSKWENGENSAGTMDNFTIGAHIGTDADIEDGNTLLFDGDDQIRVELETISASEYKIKMDLQNTPYIGEEEFYPDGLTLVWTFTPPSYVVNGSYPIAMLYDDNAGISLPIDGKSIWIEPGNNAFDLVFDSVPANGNVYILRYTC